MLWSIKPPGPSDLEAPDPGVVDADTNENETEAARLILQEARHLSRLDHPNIVLYITGYTP
jgi:hypothetical protein